MTTVPTPTTAAMPQQNLYRVLNVPQTASAEEVKKAIIQGSRLWSNRTNAPQIEKRQEAERMVKLIEEAETILLDPAKRAGYDRQLATAPSEEREVDESDLAERGDLVKEAWRLLSDGEVPDAMFVAEKATQKDGANPEAWAVLAQAKARWGDTEDAIYEFKKAIKLRPNEASYYFDLGSVYEAAERSGDALQQYERAAKIEPKTAMYRAGIGAVLVKAGKSREAAKILEQCLSEEPENATFQWSLAVAYVDSTLDNWTRVKEGDKALLAPGVYATEKSQVLEAQSFIEKAEKMKFDDTELSEHIRQRRADIDRQLKRQFRGSMLAGILGTIIWTFAFGLGLIFGPLYFWASRPPIYAINKRLLKGELTSGEETAMSEKAATNGVVEGLGGILVGNAITGLFLPIMAVWNFVRNYTGENALPKPTT